MSTVNNSFKLEVGTYSMCWEKKKHCIWLTLYLATSCGMKCHCCFSSVVEWIPTRVRTVVGTGTGYCYTTGQLILAAVAYCIRDWRWLTLAVSLPFYVSFLYSWCVCCSRLFPLLKCVKYITSAVSICHFFLGYITNTLQFKTLGR